MPVTVRIPTPLRPLANNQAEVAVNGADVGAMIESLDNEYSGFGARLVDVDGEVRRFVNIYVNDENIRFLDGKQTALSDGDTVSIVPAIAGGMSKWQPA